MDTSKLLEALKTLPPKKLALGFGFVLAAGAYALDEPPQFAVFAVGVAIFLLGLLMAVGRASAIERRIKMDMELRQKKIDAGLDPKHDKTIYKEPKN